MKWVFGKVFSLLNKLWITADTENLVSGVKSLISAFLVMKLFILILISWHVP